MLVTVALWLATSSEGDRKQQQLDARLTSAAGSQAQSLENYFEQARTNILLTARNPAFAAFYETPGRRPSRHLREAESALAYLEELYPDSIGEACLIETDGTERARVVRGEAAPPSDLSPDESVQPFFGPSIGLRPGEVHQAAPYLSPDMHEWVIANATPIPVRSGRPPAIVHFEVTIESFRQAAALGGTASFTRIVDVRSGRVVIDSRRPEPSAQLLGTAASPRLLSALRRIPAGGSAATVTTLPGGHSAVRPLARGANNANHWYVVVTSTAGSASTGAFDLGGAAVSLLLLAVLCLGGALTSFWLSARAVRSSEEHFRAVIDDASDMVTTVRFDGLVTGQSRACRRILGFEPDEVTNLALTDLVHPDDVPMALLLLRHSSDVPAVVEWRMKHRNGYWVDVETAVNDMREDQRVGALVLTTRDVTERKALEEQLRHRAFHDPLTQLPNRALFLDRTERALGREERFSDSAAILFVDLDDFKLINDRFGHSLGDEALVAVAQRLRACLRSVDTAARIGGDEFGVLLESVEDHEQPIEVAERILQALSLPLEVSGTKVTVSPSIGVVMGTCRKDSAPELLRRADIAMYAAKQQGKGRVETYRHEIHDQMDPAGASDAEPDRISVFMRTEDQRSEILALLREPDALRCVFQPIVDLRSGMVAGYEALSRFTSDANRPPDAWFAQAHRCGLGVQLEIAALTRAFAAPGRPSGTYLSVNLSPSTIRSRQLLEALPADLSGTLIEVTENELVAGGDALTASLDVLRARGARIAVDDAGAGYAGLRQLTALAPDVIKLDRCIIDGVATDPAKLALIESFVRFSAQIGAAVCAEGIERLDDLRVLADIDVTLGQGYALGRPADPWAGALAPASLVLRDALNCALELPSPDPVGSYDSESRLQSIAAGLSRAAHLGDVQTTLGSMATALHAQSVSFSLLTDDRRALSTVASDDSHECEPNYELDDYPATRRVLETQCAVQVLCGDPAADASEVALLEQLGFGGVLILPVTHDGQSIGLIEIYSTTARPWSRRETALARLFAYQLGALATTSALRRVPEPA